MTEDPIERIVSDIVVETLVEGEASRRFAYKNDAGVVVASALVTGTLSPVGAVEITLGEIKVVS